jgi:hypothetical protein
VAKLHASTLCAISLIFLTQSADHNLLMIFACGRCVANCFLRLQCSVTIGLNVDVTSLFMEGVPFTASAAAFFFFLR